jgi:hypothetical protein
VAGPYKCSKPMFTCLFNSSRSVPTISRDTVNASKTSPTITEGPAKLRVQRQNLSVGLAPHRANKARQGMASSRHFPRPH